MTPRLIPARFKGKCRICGKAVAPGTAVWFAKHYGVRCEACGPHTAADAPLPSKKGNKKYPPAAVPELPPGQQPMTGEKAAQVDADGIHRYEFGSVTEAVQTALTDFAQSDHNAEFLRNRMGQALSGKDPWANRFTRDRFLSELVSPKSSLFEAVDKMRARLVESVELPSRPRRRIRHGQDTGEDIDIDRWLARDPYCWDRNVREQQPSRNVTIGCNLSVNAAARSADLLYRGAAALALADILTQQGVNVEIVCFDSVRGPTDVVRQGVIRYVVKAGTMPLDIAAVAFAMCEIAFFRVIGAVGGSKHWPGKINEGLGSAAQLPAADRRTCDYVIDSNVLGELAAVKWLGDIVSARTTEATHV